MAYYYVKNGGTATGDAGRYASQQSGSFAVLGASGYYNDIQDAIDNSTTSPVAGDFINVSDLHSFSPTQTITYTGPKGTTGTSTSLFIVCVDDANIDQARTNGNFAFESSTGSALDVLYTGFLTISGINNDANDTLGLTSNGAVIIILDSKLRSRGANNGIRVTTTDSGLINLINTEIQFELASSVINIGNGGSLSMVGGSVTTDAVSINNLISGDFTDGGGSASFNGVDLSSVSGILLANVGGNYDADDIIDVRFDMCKLLSGVTFTNENFKSYNQRALFTRCSDSSAAAEYQYHLHAFGGDVDDDSAIFRNEDEPFTESNQKISYKIVTNSDASLGSPLWFDFPIKDYAVLSAGATDTLRFYITSAVALTDKDIYIEISYPDGTNKQTPNFLSSAPTTVGGTLDLMATGTTLTTDGVSTWTGALANLYKIELDTSGDVGADTVPIVKVYITKPSTTIQIASQFGQV